MKNKRLERIINTGLNPGRITKCFGQSQHGGLLDRFTRSRLVGRHFLAPYQDRAHSANWATESPGCLEACLDAVAVVDVRAADEKVLVDTALVVEDRGSNGG